MYRQTLYLSRCRLGVNVSCWHTRVAVVWRAMVTEKEFQRMVTLERRRAERSRRPFLLMLLDMGDTTPCAKNGKGAREDPLALSGSTAVAMLPDGTATTPFLESCSQSLHLSIPTLSRAPSRVGSPTRCARI
jgi:hypothetical protein